MRVMNPGPGELVDRLTVVELKIANAEKSSHVGQWLEENEELKAVLRGLIPIGSWYVLDGGVVVGDGPVLTKTSELCASLRQINKNIWIGIDLQKEYSKLNLDELSWGKLREIASLGLNIMEQNDLRAKLIGELNELYGIKRTEKIART